MQNTNTSISIKDREIVEYLRDQIKSRFTDFIKLYLFGSRVKANYSDESDYDIVVITDKTNKDLEKYITHLTSEINYTYDVFLEIHTLTEKEFRWNPFFYEEVTKHGLLYE